MMTLLLAAAAALPPLSDPDLRCMAGYLVVAGDTSEAANASVEDRASVQALVMYYFGKLDARFAGADLEGQIKQVVQGASYAAQLRADLERCNAEATARGQYLETFGDGQDPAGAAAPGAKPVAPAPVPPKP